MKIVQIVESTATGTLSMVQIVANQFAESGHEVHVIYSIRSDTPSNLKELFNPRVKLHHIQMTASKVFCVLKQLRTKLNDLQPDIVHLHSSFAGFLGRISTIYTLPTTKFFYSPHCISFMRKDISKIKKMTFVLLERIACIRSCKYIACSESEMNEIEKYISKSVLLIENAVDKGILKDNQHMSVEDGCKKSIVTVGGIRKQKNPELFIELAQELNSDNVDLIWIGDGDQYFKNKLNEAGVKVTGWLSREKVTEQLLHSTIYLSTSLWEGMPVSVIEAMACGLPVVASKCSGNVDVIRHRNTGLLFSNVSDGLTSIRQLLDSPDLAREIAANAVTDVNTRFCESRFFSELSVAYGC